GGIVAAKDLLDIATTLAGIRRLRRAIEATEELETLQAVVEPLRTYPEIEQEIHRCIDDNGEVAERASPKLGEIRRRIKTYRDRIYSRLQNIISRNGGAVQEAVITQRGSRFVIPVKAPQKDTIGGIVHDVSST
ncbi:MAG: endonuclease MutS2, partial [Phototrophicales bacterium]